MEQIPLVLAVEIVHDEKTAAHQVLAQTRRLLALRVPAAAPRLLQEHPGIHIDVVVRERQVPTVGRHLDSRHALQGRKEVTFGFWIVRWPTMDCKNRASLRKPVDAYARRAMWNSASGGPPFGSGGGGLPNCALASSASRQAASASSKDLARIVRLLCHPRRSAAKLLEDYALARASMDSSSPTHLRRALEVDGRQP